MLTVLAGTHSCALMHTELYRESTPPILDVVPKIKYGI